MRQCISVLSCPLLFTNGCLNRMGAVQIHQRFTPRGGGGRRMAISDVVKAWFVRESTYAKFFALSLA